MSKFRPSLGWYSEFLVFNLKGDFKIKICLAKVELS
jgi:hypothetical protein